MQHDWQLIAKSMGLVETSKPAPLEVEDDASDLLDKSARRVSEAGTVVINDNAEESPLVG